MYSWLTIATTTDVALITNSASTPLPIIQTNVPIVGFYWAAPVILLTLYIYLHLYLQSMWEGLASLPAVFPDGRTLDQKAYPWLLMGIVRAYVPMLENNRPSSWQLRWLLSIVSAWLLVPFTIFLFWLRYLPRHDWFGATLLVAAILVACWTGIANYQRARVILSGAESGSHPKRFLGGVTATFAFFLLIATYGAINGIRISIGEYQSVELSERYRQDSSKLSDPNSWIPFLFSLFGYSTFADLQEKNISTRPEDWWKATSSEEVFEGVRGATLSGSNLRYADAWYAFLAKANLDGANLQGALFTGADFQEASLERANLQDTMLEAANSRTPISPKPTSRGPT